MFSNSKFEGFDPQRSKWPRFCEQLKHFLIANKVEEKLKLSTVLSLIGDYSFNLLCDLIAPDSPSSKTVEEVFDILNQHFSPKPIARSERFKFRSRKQERNESILDYVAALRKLSLDCDFKGNLDFHLADQFVFGISNVAIQKRLLAEEDSTSFVKLIQLATIAEMTSHVSVELSETVNHSRNIFKVQHLSKNNASVTSTKQDCKHCGSFSHLSKKCKFIDAICNFCKKKGHISPICRQKKFMSDKPGQSDNIARPRKVHKVTQFSMNDKKTVVINNFSINQIEATYVKPIMIRLKVNNAFINFELDTGAAVSLIPLNIFKKHLSSFKYTKTNVVLNTLSHSILPVGKILVDVTYHNKQTRNLELIIVKEGTTPLLGRTWFAALGLLQDIMASVHSVCPLDIPTELEKLSMKFKLLFSPILGSIQNFKAHLFIKDGAIPRFFKYRPVPFALLPLIEAELDKLQGQGILTPIKFSDWAAPIVPIVKKDNSIRLCGDYKVGLNPVLMVDQYPLPIIDEMLAKLAGGVIFSKLDMTQAYQQVTMDEDSAKYLTINTHKGLFRVNRLPFGISSAPAIFQELMDKILNGFPNVVCYLDDILISSPDLTSHFQTLDMVFQRLEKAGIRLNHKKCEFVKKEVTYLGHVVDSTGIHASQDKISSLLSAPEPENVDQLRSFLGLINYYRKFLPNLASSLAPLNALLRKDTKWCWGKDACQAFVKAKNAVTSLDVLVHFDPKLPLVLATDASPVGLGAVISHLCPDGLERPIAFASRTLSVAEKNYSQLDKEALGIIFGVKKFHQYLFGRNFTLLTDHKPLTYIFSADKHVPPLASARLQRWALILTAYSYNIKFRSSKANLNADALSRSPCNVGETTPDEIPEDVFLINQVESFPVSHEDIAAETLKDCSLKQVLHFTKVGWPRAPISSDLTPFKSRAEEISLQEGCLLWGQRVLIPKSLRFLLLKELHRHHTGMVRMKMMARSLFWWPRLDQDIEHIAHTCEKCALLASDPPKAPLHPWIRPDKPWERIHIDFAGPFMGHMFMVTVDAFSKWPEVAIMSSTDTLNTVTVLERYFTHYGYPMHIVTDNGSQFISADFNAFCKNRGISHSRSAPYHPSSNGQAERFVEILKSFLKKMDIKQTMDFKVNELLFSYRSTPHSLTKKSPAELFLGRVLRNRLRLIQPPIKQRFYEPVSSTKPRSFNVGQKVLTKSFGRKHVGQWIHAKIHKKLGPVTYLLEFQDGKYGKRHVDQIRFSFLHKEGMTRENNSELDLSVPIILDTTQPQHQDSGTPYSADATLVVPVSEAPVVQRRYPERIRRPPSRFEHQPK